MARIGNESKLILKLARERMEKECKDINHKIAGFSKLGQEKEVSYHTGFINGMRTTIELFESIHYEMEN